MRLFTIKPYTGWRIDFDNTRIRDDFIDNCSVEFPLFTDYINYDVFGIDIKVPDKEEGVAAKVQRAITSAARKEMMK